MQARPYKVGRPAGGWPLTALPAHRRHPKGFEDFYPNESVAYPPEVPHDMLAAPIATRAPSMIGPPASQRGFQITTDVPVMAPHDWTTEGDGAGDLKDLNIGADLCGVVTRPWRSPH
jgi:hypothetical protein